MEPATGRFLDVEGNGVLVAAAITALDRNRLDAVTGGVLGGRAARLAERALLPVIAVNGPGDAGTGIGGKINFFANPNCRACTAAGLRRNSFRPDIEGRAIAIVAGPAIRSARRAAVLRGLIGPLRRGRTTAIGVTSEQTHHVPPSAIAFARRTITLKAVRNREMRVASSPGWSRAACAHG